MVKSVRQQTVRIRQTLIAHVDKHPSDLVTFAAKSLRLTRQAVYRHVDGLVRAGVLEATGRTHARRYSLKSLAAFAQTYPLAGLEEHVPWERDVQPLISNAPPNVRLICN